jgi:hypothetical protein
MLTMDQGSIANAADLENFVQIVQSFHDGIIKEIHWVNSQHVGEDFSMWVEGLPSARVLVQTQWADPGAVELTLFNVRKMYLDTEQFVFDSQSSTVDDYLRLDIQDSYFEFESATYRSVDWLGETIRYSETNANPAIE